MRAAVLALVAHLGVILLLILSVLVAAAAGGPAFNAQQTGSILVAGGNKQPSARLANRDTKAFPAADCHNNSQIETLHGQRTSMQNAMGSEGTVPIEPKQPAAAGVWDVWAYNDAMAKKTKGDGSFSATLGVLEEMKANNVEPNLVTYNVVFETALNNFEPSQAAAAVDLFAGVPTGLRGHQSYVAVMKLLSLLGRHAQAMELVAAAKRHGLHPDQQALEWVGGEGVAVEEGECDSDDDVAAAPIKDSELDWASAGGGGGGGGGGEKPPAGTRIDLVLAKGQVQAERLDQYLAGALPFLSRTAVQSLIKTNCVSVCAGTKACKPAAKLKGGDSITVTLPAPPGCAGIKAEELPLSILHEDAHLIAVNKQAGLTVHPWNAVASGTLVNALAWHLQHAPDAASLSSVGAASSRPGIVHRLDRFTTGVIVVAKSDLAHWRLSEHFAQRKVDKRYLAVVHGEVAADQGLIDAAIGRDPEQRERMCVRDSADKGGKHAKTIYRVRERYGGFSLVELQLLTGRTHQIRVHLSHIGHPIAGDPAYGGRLVSAGELEGGREGGGMVLLRQALHATTIRFEHPITKKTLALAAPLHKDMLTAVRVLRGRAGFRPAAVSGATVKLEEVGL